jgi:hypothetical protein
MRDVVCVRGTRFREVVDRTGTVQNPKREKDDG